MPVTLILFPSAAISSIDSSVSSAMVRLFLLANLSDTISIDAPVSGNALIVVSVFLLLCLVMQALRFTSGVGLPELPAKKQLTDVFPFLQMFLDTAEFASYLSFVLRAECFSARTTHVIHLQANGCFIGFIPLGGGVCDSGLIPESDSESRVEGAAGGDSGGVSAGGGEFVELVGLHASNPAEELEL